MSSFHEDNKENVRGLDVLSVAEAKIEVIRETHDYYFAKDKQSTLKKLVTEVDHLLEDIPVEAWENCTELTGRYWCLRGIAWNYLSATSDAEKYLEKAVEVSEGKKAEPLCHLAQCLWKRGDLSLAIELYKRSLEAGESAEALRCLSVLMRLNSSTKDRPAVVAAHSASIDFGRKALALDMDDARSWYTLGTAYATHYFAVSADIAHLHKALQAYKCSESRPNGDRNPDLFASRGNLARFLQDFTLARRSFQKALELDSSGAALASAHSLQQMEQWLNRISSLLGLDPSGGTGGGERQETARGVTQQPRRAASSSIKPKRLSAMARALQRQQQLLQPCRPELTLTSLAQLHGGVNPCTRVLLKLFLPVTANNVPPESFIAVDANMQLCVVSIYNLGSCPQLLCRGGDSDKANWIEVRNPILRSIRANEVNLATLTESSNAPSQEPSKSAHLREPSSLAPASKFAIGGINLVQVFELSSIRINGSMPSRAAVKQACLVQQTFDG